MQAQGAGSEHTHLHGHALDVSLKAGVPRAQTAELRLQPLQLHLQGARAACMQEQVGWSTQALLLLEVHTLQPSCACGACGVGVWV